jgi:hypothetical protein
MGRDAMHLGWSNFFGAIKTLASAQKRSKTNQILVDRFTNVFQENLWGDSESVSGPGSRKDSPSVAAAVLALKYAKKTINFESISDIPCGDFNWIRLFLQDDPNVRYRGFDIVSELISNNKQLYNNYEFLTLDITSEFPPYSDLIFSKDLFNHLSYADIYNAITNMQRSKSQYLLASNNFGLGFTNVELTGDSRFLDLCSEPLNLSRPIWHTDYMGLWKLQDIRLVKV